MRTVSEFLDLIELLFTYTHMKTNNLVFDLDCNGQIASFTGTGEFFTWEHDVDCTELGASDNWFQIKVGVDKRPSSALMNLWQNQINLHPKHRDTIFSVMNYDILNGSENAPMNLSQEEVYFQYSTVMNLKICTEELTLEDYRRFEALAHKLNFGTGFHALYMDCFFALTDDQYQNIMANVSANLKVHNEKY